MRRSVYVEGVSERAAARRFGLARETVRKMLRYRLPPGYRRATPIRCPKLDAFTRVIDQILTDDQQRPKKQRHTAKRIWERLRAEPAFTGGYTIVKDYVRRRKLGGQEMFVPLVHPPGDAQADFGEALVVVAGVACTAHDLVVDLPHSDDAFVKACPAETTEAFCDGHNAAFHYFGGVPRGIVYDNTKLAVARMLGDGTRQRTQVFSELQSHDLFDDRFGRPGKGNDTGKVEGLVGDARRNFFVPVPRVASWDALNADVARQCRKGGPKLDHGGGGKLDHPARWTACLRVAVRPGWSGGWARLWAGPDGAEARLHSQQRAKGGVRTPERQRRGGRACCVRGDSCRRSAPECGRDGSTGRAARRSAGQSRRSRSIRSARRCAIEPTHRARAHPRAPQRFGDTSSTRRTLTPARYISISASSTDASRRRYCSMIAVSNGSVRSFGTLSVMSPASVWSFRS